MILIARSISAAALMGLLLFAEGLQAGTIGPSCASCFGGVYSLDSTLINNSTAGQETWRIEYGLDLSGFNGPPEALYVSSLAAKVASKPNLISWAAIGAPTAGLWNYSSGGLNNSGCSGSGGGWVCIEWESGDQLLTGASTSYSWVFDVTIKAGTLLGNDASIKANFDPPRGLLMSENISTKPTALPEPAAVAELALLLGLVGAWVIWQRMQGGPSRAPHFG